MGSETKISTMYEHALGSYICCSCEIWGCLRVTTTLRWSNAYYGVFLNEYFILVRKVRSFPGKVFKVNVIFKKLSCKLNVIG